MQLPCRSATLSVSVLPVFFPLPFPQILRYIGSHRCLGKLAVLSHWALDKQLRVKGMSSHKSLIIRISWWHYLCQCRCSNAMAHSLSIWSIPVISSYHIFLAIFRQHLSSLLVSNRELNRHSQGAKLVTSVFFNPLSAHWLFVYYCWNRLLSNSVYLHPTNKLSILMLCLDKDLEVWC